MPTSSVLKPLNISGKKQVKKFIRALKSAERFDKSNPAPKVGVSYTNMSKEDIAKFFNNK